MKGKKHTPVDAPARWLQHVNQPQSPAEEQAVLRSLKRSSPMGDDR